MGLLSDPELGPAAADGFSLLMSDCTDVLTRAGHAEVRIMFRQRFFTDNVPALVRGFHAAPQGEERLEEGPRIYRPLFCSAHSQNLGPECFFRA
jgi:hypothetical protein